MHMILNRQIDATYGGLVSKIFHGHLITYVEWLPCTVHHGDFYGVKDNVPNGVMITNLVDCPRASHIRLR